VGIAGVEAGVAEIFSALLTLWTVLGSKIQVSFGLRYMDVQTQMHPKFKFRLDSGIWMSKPNSSNRENPIGF
jgi:hypothetical protein